MQVLVARKEAIARDVFLFELASPDGHALPAFEPGAHIDVEVAPGLVRPYSLCNDAAERARYQIAVLRDPDSRGGSSAMHERVHAGDLIRISEPRNHFSLAPDAPQSLLFAGGIGVTPILCMARRLASVGADFIMHYCARSFERMAFREQLEQGRFADKVHLHVDGAGMGHRLDIAAVLSGARSDAHLYVCGPGGFLDSVRDTAAAAGWEKERIHFERFCAEPLPPQATDDFDVQLARSGRTVRVRTDQSIVQALAEAGIDVPVSCEQGVCGTCLTRVLDGVPDHRDQYLMDPEKAANDQMLLCCSRARTPSLRLDL